MKHYLRLFLFALLTIALNTGYAQIYSYTSDTSGLYNSIAANTTAVKLTRVNGATKPSSPCGTGFSNATFTLTNTTYATTDQAIEADVTANAGYSLNVTGFSVGTRRSGTGPDSIRLAYSTDGGTTWIDQGSGSVPNSGSCGSTVTASWTTAFTVPAGTTLKYRIYGYAATNLSGTLQLLNLLINGTVTSTDSIYTSAASFGPFCANVNDTISVPFTTVGTFGAPFYVQLSDASGIFPNDATSNLISSGDTLSPATAVIPASTPWANGYRVRVVNQSPTFYASGDNGNNIVINQSVTPLVAILDSPTAVCAGSPVTFYIDSIVNGGSTPAYEWYVNGIGAGTGSSYSSGTFANVDTVFLLITSDAACASPAIAQSNKIGVTIYAAQSSSSADTICPGTSVTFGGNTLTTSGTYTTHLNTVNGCDSAVTLNLVVLTTHRDTITANICQGTSYPLNGTTYTIAGTYSDTIRCDSIVTLVLSYKTVHTTTVTASICQGDAYTFNGHTYTTAGSYNDTVRCDSIVTLVLSYKTVHTTTVTASVCQGDAYTLNGNTYTTAGSYNDTVRCDSIVTLVLSYKTVHTTAATGSICAGDAFLWNGTSYTTAGVYTDTVRCDSIVTLTLTVNAKPTVVATLTGSTQLSTTTFASYVWLLNGSPISGATGQTYTATQTGNYSVIGTDANGCFDTSAAVAVVVNGITEANTLNAHIYPNPTEGIVYIDADGLASVEVVDMLGRSVLSMPVAKGSAHTQVDISSFNAGMYIMIIRDANDGVAIRNISKQ
jgi:hypothetical protein